MILSTADITAIILENPGAEIVKKGQAYSTTLRRHLYGEGLEKHITAIAGFERESVHALRKAYARSNKALFSRLMRPIDKVFTAKGGSLYYNLPDTAEKRARQMTQNLPNGMTVRKWVETFWRSHLMDDPFGLVFMELLPMQDAIQAKNAGNSFVYPTYKSISTVYDYKLKGSKVEYVAFKMDSSEKKEYGIKDEVSAFRVVDDSFDYIVIHTDKDKVEILAAFTLRNFFGEVPAILNSDLVDASDEDCVLSPLDPVIELAEDFLLDGSIRRVHKFLHGFPKYVEYGSVCHECKGSGKKEAKTCEACGGSGKKAMTRVSDVKLLEWPESKEENVILPADTAAYISPDQTFHDISTADLADLENSMHVTLWGSQGKVQTSGMSQSQDGTQRTATEVMDEMKPEADRLIAISEMAETRHKFILDKLITLNLSLPGYQGSSVNYGRRYLLEGPDTIWLKYSDARTKGSPQNILDTLLNEYFEANYQSDPVGLAIAKKLMYVEPFVHLTTQQLQTLTPDPADYKAKLYFSEWLATVNEATLLSSTVEQLRADLLVWSGAKQLPQPEPKALPAA